jgi:hypothetical protein
MFGLSLHELSLAGDTSRAEPIAEALPGLDYADLLEFDYPRPCRP